MLKKHKLLKYQHYYLIRLYRVKFQKTVLLNETKDLHKDLHYQLNT